MLNKIQKIKEDRAKDFNGRYYTIPLYDNKKLFNEAKLFCDWYVKKTLSKKKTLHFNRLIKKEFKFLLKEIKLENNTFVHGDFHVSNLMKYKNKIAIIDTQDASIGNKAYDLASLIDDVRFQTSKNFKNKIYNYYLNLNKKNINKKFFENDFEILSILRNLKIIGIFTRLAVRDKKNKYLRLIPYTWELIEMRIKNKKIFKRLKKLLDYNFSKKIRTKK